MGLIPIYVYSDVPWVPYALLFRKVGYITDLDGLPPLLRALHRTPRAALAVREAQAAALGASHFSMEAVMGQIARFLVGGASDLQCVPLPSTTRDAGPCGAGPGTPVARGPMPKKGKRGKKGHR